MAKQRIERQGIRLVNAWNDRISWYRQYDGNAPRFFWKAFGIIWKLNFAFIIVTGSNRVMRGGSWNNNDNNCRSANRNNNDPSNRNNNNGFRLVKTLSGYIQIWIWNFPLQSDKRCFELFLRCCFSAITVQIINAFWLPLQRQLRWTVSCRAR